MLNGEVGIRPKDYESLLLANYDKVVTDDDIVIFFGDMLFKPATTKAWFSHIMQTLKGKKILVRGNHDRKQSTSDIYWLVECGFHTVYDEYMLIDDILLSHVPISCKEERVFDLANRLNSVYNFCGCNLNIHGHLHEYKTNDDRCLSMCPELNNYMPVNITKYFKDKGELT